MAECHFCLKDYGETNNGHCAGCGGPKAKKENDMNTSEPEVVIALTEQLAIAITRLADVGQALQASTLKQETIILLLHNMTKVGKKDIAYILNALPELRRQYLKPIKKPVG